jgi:glutamate/tyrosine decarboxylase-like PLP-dependent enzyme
MKPADINPDDRLTPVFARRPLVDVPKNRMPAGEIAADTAYEIIHDELMLDGNSRQNLATFVTTWMEPQAEKLMAETFDKNMVDRDEYPQTAEIERRCLEIVSSLWNSPSAASSEAAVGTSTVGSSEAAMLGGLAMLDRVARPRAPSRRLGVLHQLPRWPGGDDGDQLLAPGEPSRGSVLQRHSPRS